LKDFKRLRIVYLGTPDFAVAPLEALCKAGACIVAVVTAPDKPAGRGMKVKSSAVKLFADRMGIPVLQPEKMKSPHFIAQLRDVKADIQVVVAFRMLPEVVWNMPALGTINLHASLLPQYRGAAPINRAIMNGEKITGLTTFKLKQEIDTGNILLQETMSIMPDETAGSLHDRMMVSGAALVVETIRKICANDLIEKPQPVPVSELKMAPKIYPETCQIDWHKTVDDIYNHIRGLSPYPAAFTFLDGKKLKIFHTEKELITPDHTAGTMVSDYSSYIKFAAKDGYIVVNELQWEGRKRMFVRDFIRGYRPGKGV
jgi:methionyl-tRNA formyltransferase